MPTVIIKKVEKLKDQISSLKELEKIKEDELNAILCRIPNLPSKMFQLVIMKKIILNIKYGEINQNLHLNLKDILK